MTKGGITEYPVLESEYRKLFSMEWMHDLDTKSVDDLTLLLGHCVEAAEQGVSRLTLEEVMLSVSFTNGRQCEGMEHDGITSSGSTDSKSENPPLLRPLSEEYAQRRCKNGTKEARALHRVAPDGTLVKQELPPCTEKVVTPRYIQDIQPHIASSTVAIYPGSRDKRGSAVIIVLCRHPGWETEGFTSSHLARLLLYYHTLPREEVRSRGFTLIVDARGTTLNVLNAFLETIYIVEANVPGAISIVHVLADRVAQSLLFRSAVFRPQVNIKIDLVMSVSAMYKFVEHGQLPPVMGGSLNHNHTQWIHFRLRLEPFVRSCRAAAAYLVGLSEELATSDSIPKTLEETQAVLRKHEESVRKAFQDPRLERLQDEGETVLGELQQMADVLGHSEDYTDSMTSTRRLFQQVQETICQLVKLADERMYKLEKCLQLRQYEKDAAQVIDWLVSEGEEMLTRHTNISDNLKGIRSQQKDFDKLYFTAMKHIGKGNDMLEEASVLSQTQSLEQVTGIKDIARELKTRLRTYTTRLDDLKDKIENTAECYHLLDKAYEWALEAMKYVSGIKMDSNIDTVEIDRLLKRLDFYLQEHPPIAEEQFDHMIELAKRVDNEKLHSQCVMAKSRCTETNNLIKVRQNTLRRAKEKMILEEKQRQNSMSSGMLPYMSDSEPVWIPQMNTSMSEAMQSALRRRSYAGKPSRPMYSPAAQAFRENMHERNLAEYEVHLFNEGLITEDMSDRIVTSLPKGLSDCTLRNSRESLRGSRESLRGSTENLCSSRLDSSNSKSACSDTSSDLSQSLPLSSSLPTQCTLNQTTLNKHNKPHRKMMRRTTSLLTGAEGEVQDSRRNGMHLSMITGSTESLPSMPEEEEIPCNGDADGEEGERKYMWTPVPVNTHLMSRQTGSSLTSYHSMADLRLSDEEIKRRRTLQNVMTELIQTERDYVRSLQFVIETYLPELQREDVPQALRGKRNIIFGNIEKIYQFHSQFFLAELENCDNTPYQLCHCFLDHVSEFYLYALYNKNKPKSDALMMEYGSQFFRKKQVQLGDRLDLNSYLLKPVQRMGKYALLLKQIISECPETEPEYHDLKAALEMVKFQLRHGNDLLAMDSLRECDVNLQEQGQLLRQEEFIVYQGRKKSLRRVFLFEELILFSKPKRTHSGNDLYIYKNSLKTSDMGMTENVGDMGMRFEIWFRKRTAADTYMLQAASVETKQTWVREIARILWKQAIRNRERRLADMERHGLGSKPCLDLKPSKNNIHDRFVNISLQNRIPRSRNSIAVMSSDHMKNGNKRPHSIISVSSNSSSNSSHSSGMFSGIHHPLDPAFDSPVKGMARSLTMCSNESGIVPDMGNTSPSTDACTQTTLKRPGRRSTSAAINECDSVSLTTSTDGAGHSSHLLSTDV